MCGRGGPPKGRSKNAFVIELLKNAGFEGAEFEIIVRAFDSVCQSLAIGDNSYALQNLVALKIVDLAVRGERNPDRISDSVQADLRESIPKDASEGA